MTKMLLINIKSNKIKMQNNYIVFALSYRNILIF